MVHIRKLSLREVKLCVQWCMANFRGETNQSWNLGLFNCCAPSPVLFSGFLCILHLHCKSLKKVVWNIRKKLNHKYATCMDPSNSTISHLLSFLQSVTFLACSLDASLWMPAVVPYYCIFQDAVLLRVKKFFVFYMYYLCENYSTALYSRLC